VKAHELEDNPGGHIIEPGQAVHQKGKKIKKGERGGGKQWGHKREGGRGSV